MRRTGLGLMAFAIVAALAIVDWGCSKPPSVAPAQTAAPAQTVAPSPTGKALYEVNCAICHGPAGDGDGPVGENMTPKASRLNDSVIASRSDDSIFTSIKNGVMRDGRQTMPPAKDLSAEQISQVVTYIRTLQKNR
ncbi:MAG: cytochrome c [Acidobacteriota bacterium]